MHTIRGRTAGTAAVVAFLAGGCGAADAGEGEPAPWDEISDYSFTLEYFDGKCGGTSRGAWSLTVHDDETTDVRPLNAPARTSTWPEGAPTLKELYMEALDLTRGSSYDVVRIKYEDRQYDRRPTSFYYLDRGSGGSEGCETFTDFRPLGAISN
ncbi:hypothetical protein [Actinopolymorpha cephalotaxi]|uniref:Lipoprotein n=1 Tax=Actinopolymorpha cephalotaxi TaxID=504797 RepID=A0ABX2S6B8_9ACTN|nr:hypothetical protein [Actinopolymorpha cephalotaxi]NYH85180.1 hypothetical protein [Actinopolymorpha cephalotaxi]